MSSGKPDRARMKAAEQLAAQRAKERRQRVLVVSAVALAVLVLAAAVGISVYLSGRPQTVLLPRNATRAGVTVGQSTAPVAVDVYLDFQCPVCKNFETQNGSTLESYVEKGAVKLTYHPMAILDRMSSGTRYSTRASAASGCASDAGKLPAFVTALYANQPAEGGKGLTNAKMISLAASAGITGSTFTRCIDDQKYAGWTTAVTDESSKAGVVGTPTVKVNGKSLSNPTTAVLTAAINAAT